MRRNMTWLAGTFAGIAVAGVVAGEAPTAAAQSPCQRSLDYLAEQVATDPATLAAFDATYQGLAPLPPGYTYNGSADNPWATAGSGAGLAAAVGEFYREVCLLLPQIVGTKDNALDSIQYFAWLYYQNEAGVQMVSGIDPNNPSLSLDSVANFLILFNQDYKARMDDISSTTYVPEWVANPRIEIEDYVLQDAADYTSWNQFFARNLIFDPVSGTYPSRPVTMPGRDYVVVSPTDCIMNPLVQVVEQEPGEVTRRWIENPLQLDTVLDVKGIPMSVEALLANAPADLKARFVGGTGLSCVLMPNTYHHYHSPVDGMIAYAELVVAEENGANPYAFGTFGYSDWPNWVPMSGNVGRPGTDFSQFQGFQRGVVIIEVTYQNLPDKEPAELKGYVASIPVGLDTVGSVVLDDAVVAGAAVTKGVTRIGNFYFGGSLNILIFSPVLGSDGVAMVTPAVQTRMGNQIAILNTPYPPPRTPWTPD